MNLHTPEELDDTEFIQLVEVRAGPLPNYPGIYIMQNTMVRGGDGQPGRRKIGVREKIKKGKENRRKIILKKKEKVLKMHLFGI